MTFLWRLRRPTLALLLMASSAIAAPPDPVVTVGGLVPRGDVTVPDGAVEAFTRGATEARVRVEPTASAPISSSRARLLKTGLSALARGEQAYLQFEMEVADRHLADAVDALLDEPTALSDAAPAIRAVLMLAQVRLTAERRDDAERVLTRATLAFPGFPEGGGFPPPPDVQALIERIREESRGQLRNALTVESVPPGLEVRINGVPVGKTPVEVMGLPARPVRVRVSVSETVSPSRLVDLTHERRARTLFDVGGTAARAALEESIRGGSDPEAGWAAAGALQQALSADQVCVAVHLNDGRVVVARLDADARRIAGAHEGAASARGAAWQALGRFCGAKAPSNLPPAQAEAALWPEAFAGRGQGEGLLTRDNVGWGAVGLGAAFAGVGVWFGLDALSAQNDFDEARSARAADDAADQARRSALIGDLSYGAAAALVATGIYLLLTRE